ncbi:Fc.00g006750.m01.CDS01 [Cosmosporella sp. VM-42]
MGTSNNDRKRSRNETEDISPDAIEARDNGAVQSSKRARTEEKRSLFVRSLPPGATSETLTDFFSEHFPVKHATVVVDNKTKESRGYGFVTLADAEDALEAKKTMDKQEWDGRKIRIDIAQPRSRDAAKGPKEAPAGKPLTKEEGQNKKQPKLIVRNLPWSIKTSEQLSALFRSFGLVKYADLPQTKGKLKGFGFVTIRGQPNAERALKAINGKEIDGRTLAVDWAVDKETWTQQHPEEGSGDAGKDKNDEDDEADDAEEDDTSVESEDDEEGGAKTNRDEGLDADLENFMKNHMTNMEDEDSDEEEISDGEDEDEATTRAPPKRTTDNSSTLFIRNLPFTATDEQLKTFFSHFGTVRYARVVMDKTTDRPAGTGFVCFFSVDDAKNCIKGAPRPQQPVTTNKSSILQDESADPDGKYTLDGRLLSVAQAVNKEVATTLADSSVAKRNQKDKRRLFLLSEGQVNRNSPLFDQLTQAEIHMRDASAAQRKKMVQKNPSLHLSLTRLALRNVPRNIDSKELKELARKAVVGFAKDVQAGRRQPLSKEENARDGKDAKENERERKAKGKGIIRQAKVIFESTSGSKIPESKDGGGKSRGYGFIEYVSHHWALMGLRYLNGHQLENESGKKQRIIAEFAIENAQVVQRRKAAEERSRQLNPEHKASSAKAAPETKGNRRDRGSFKDDKAKSRGRKGGKPADVEEAEDNAAPKDPKEEMKQKLIARKRLVRKKKASFRGKN